MFRLIGTSAAAPQLARQVAKLVPLPPPTNVPLPGDTVEIEKRGGGDIEALLKPGAVVAGVEFVSKAQALDRFKQTFADLASTISTLVRGTSTATVGSNTFTAGSVNIAAEASWLDSTPG